MSGAHRARKRFGQNFLHDPAVIQRIVEAIHPQAGDKLVEIGPGLGALTLPLLASAGSMDAVELDRDVIPPLRARAQDRGELRIHNADALRFDFSSLCTEGEKLRLVGNLPYNISTPLLFHLLQQAEQIIDMHFMLQREVVERMVAGPGSKVYGRLSVSLALHTRCEPLFTVGPGAFKPPPKVESTVVRIVPQAAQQPRDRVLFDQLVSKAFSARRKTLSNALRGLVERDSIKTAGIDPGLRPEQIEPQAYRRLADLISNGD